MIVRSFMTPDPVALRPESSCNAALSIMQTRGFHHLPVTGEDARVVGIVAERDLLLAALNYSGGTIDVAQVMHRDVIMVRDDMPVTHAASLMARRAIGGLPVIDATGHLIGIITESDIFRAFVTVLESRTARPTDGLPDAAPGPAPVASVATPKSARGNGAAKPIARPAAQKKARKAAAGAGRR